ncbi:hypothetical protein AYO41_01425 [Verrucomicrobia bacterium SCGC AG-212-E04]|nr:hypothetical protein AYO41_01425 [Verrucomicrobia bacterium SCGC AG-212-E04]
MNAQFDDPNLTAYALGESLSDEELAAIEELLAESPEARALVADVHQLAEDLRAEYEAERTDAMPSPELSNIIEFNGPHRVTSRTRSTAHLPRVAALVAASLTVASVAWFSMRPAEPNRIATSKQNASAPASAASDDPGAYLEMEWDGPAGTATASGRHPGYESVRRLLTSNRLPPKGAVRIEDLVNRFSYRYAPPAANARDALAVHLEVAGSPWNAERRLVRVGIKGRDGNAVQRSNPDAAAIAKDVVLEVEFNPALVASYQLIGYEARPSVKADSHRDQITAGDFTAGQALTALYEVVPTDRIVSGAELLNVKVRYRAPAGEERELPGRLLVDDGRTFDAASPDFRFASAVAGFGMVLRDSPERGDATPASILKWAEAGLSDDAAGDRREFAELVRKADALLAAGRAGAS